MVATAPVSVDVYNNRRVDTNWCNSELFCITLDSYKSLPQNQL